MGASMPGGGGKSSNFELNLVPFIDMFSTLICFLLITAAWQNLESVNTGAAPKHVESLQDTPPSSPQPEVKKVALSVVLHFDKIDISEDNVVHSLAHRGRDPDIEGLSRVLKEWKKKYPARRDLVLATENRAPYKHLIGLMDVFIRGEFPEVAITLN